MQALPDDVLVIWVVYNSPSDFPGVFVARKWRVRAGSLEHTPEVMADYQLIPLRERLVTQWGMTQCILRDENDDKAIVEAWF